MSTEGKQEEVTEKESVFLKPAPPEMTASASNCLNVVNFYHVY